jgi:hypothetical protein
MERPAYRQNGGLERERERERVNRPAESLIERSKEKLIER